MVKEEEVRFFGYKHPLSNLYEKTFRIGDIIFPTVEHYYQSRRTDDEFERFDIFMADTPEEAKKIGRWCEFMREDWDERKTVYMYKGIKAKMSQNEDLKKYLLDTDDKKLICDNRNEYWGCGKKGDGQNMCGKILMLVRNDLKGV